MGLWKEWKKHNDARRAKSFKEFCTIWAIVLGLLGLTFVLLKVLADLGVIE